MPEEEKDVEMKDAEKGKEGKEGNEAVSSESKESKSSIEAAKYIENARKMFTEGQKKIAEGKKQVHVAQVKAEKGQKKIDEGEVKTHKAVSALLAIRTLLVEISSYYRKMHEVKKEKQSRTEAAELGDPESISWMTTYLENSPDSTSEDELKSLKEKWIMTLTSQGIEREANKVLNQGGSPLGALLGNLGFPMNSDLPHPTTNDEDNYMRPSILNPQGAYVNPAIRMKENFVLPAPSTGELGT
eukprot:gnl/TRDRNA2_/TRDRNA2_175877_c1_seq4.p1 gnl/TRDRNA2_/TRDRNA2_175877_c1~~gnl/TRDRNA2_/TRDRNA2_175877_c1_seq4.p1  ORF type:complete len:280 (+),score=65.02 gnl/TRDRNA2_/TRDRNA2_175877_c1_seq4:112-840(+)